MVETVPTDQPDGPPAYAQPSLQTVEEVWREWKAGVNGGPAISQLEERWGASWRRSGQQAQWFCRRKVVWDKVKELISLGHSEAAAVENVELLRGGGTLYQLVTKLKRERQDDGEGRAGSRRRQN
jgi:Transcriptional activator of glycolytic enzymes